MSASDILRKFAKRDMTSHQSRRALDEFLRSPCYGFFLKSLQGPDILSYANFLDKALDLIPTTDKLWTSSLNALRQICGGQTILPTTHVLSRRLIKRGNASIPTRDSDSCWKAQYTRRAVRVRCLRIAPASDQALIKKLCHESVLWRRLNHPNVTLVLGVTMDPYQVVFDRVSNVDVIQYTLSREVDRVSLTSDIAEGLGYLHSQKVVHGRLRGAGILVNEDGRAVLTDFGSASVAWSSEDISHEILRWCAPEVLGSDEVSCTRPTYASDVFSFGMVVLEIFSGKVPFDEVSDDEAFKWVRSGARPNKPAGAAGVGLSDSLWTTIQQCWNGSPDLRPGIADVLDYTREVRPTLPREYTEPPASSEQSVNPNAALKVNRWKRFSNLMGNFFGSSQTK